jgi:hypothetical protein
MDFLCVLPRGAGAGVVDVLDFRRGPAILPVATRASRLSELLLDALPCGGAGVVGSGPVGYGESDDRSYSPPPKAGLKRSRRPMSIDCAISTQEASGGRQNVSAADRVSRVEGRAPRGKGGRVEKKMSEALVRPHPFLRGSFLVCFSLLDTSLPSHALLTWVAGGAGAPTHTTL